MRQHDGVTEPQAEPTILKARMEIAVAGGLGAGALSLLLHLLAGLGDISTVVIVGVVVPVVFRKGQVLELSSEGASIGESGSWLPGLHRTASWSELRLVKGLTGYYLRTPKGTPYRSRFGVMPATYERDWRGGVFGDQLRRFAPHLLADDVTT